MADSYRQEEADLELARRSLTAARIIELKAMRPTVRRFITANYNKITTLVDGSNRLMRKVVQEGEQYEKLWAELALVDENEDERKDTKEYYEKLIEIIAKVDRALEERTTNDLPMNSTRNVEIQPPTPNREPAIVPGTGNAEARQVEESNIR